LRILAEFTVLESLIQESPTKRREFLSHFAKGVSAAAVSGAAGELFARRDDTASAASPKLQRVAISTWSFHNYFPVTRDEDFKGSGESLKLVDFPEMVADRYHVHTMEFVAPHFESTDPAYLNELKTRLAKV